MKYKTYYGETLQQALLKMRIDLGKDAFVVSHKQIKKGGIFGLGGKKLVEVVARKSNNDTNHDDKELKIQPISRDFSDKNKTSDTHIRQEIQELKSALYNIMQELKVESPQRYPGACMQVYNELLKEGIKSHIANDLIRKVVTVLSLDQLNDEEIIRYHLKQQLMQLIRVADEIQVNHHLPSIAVFVGPTGVGKTTTLAKLAALFKFNKNKKISIMTIDTYRIAAVEQLNTYAKIIDVPLDVIFTPSEFRTSIDKQLNQVDLILVDTAGRSQRNDLQIAELKTFLSQVGHKLEVLLLLSLTTKDEELIDIVDRFRCIRFDKVIFTKLDEAVSYGNMINLLCYINQGVAYVTTGQNVPEDIEVAHPNGLAELLLNKTKRR